MYSFALVVALFCFNISTVYANSYLDMITTEPQQSEEKIENVYKQPENVNSSNTQAVVFAYTENSVLGETHSPVVVSPAYKYAAWKRAQENQDKYYNPHEDVQNFIYLLGGVAVGRISYDIWGPHHRHHWADKW